ncbi:MAG TPA: hypothetical protein VJ750_05450 [Rhizomicrobium sp.]|nr:hypothetical protein [Rhizomicrobium sp.]
MLRTACAALLVLAAIRPALAADCATPSEAAALKTAILQQQLMVAALQCRESAAYNRFVTVYRNQLQSSDATLKNFFIRKSARGQASYDSFKTKAANLSALEQARNGSAFCAGAHALFAETFAHRGDLMSLVESRSAGTDIGGICTLPVLARADTETRAAEKTTIAVEGVPQSSRPALPYRHQATAPRARDEARGEESYDAAPSFAEEPPRAYQVHNRGYYGYEPPNYGQPPAWWPQPGRDEPAPAYGWYPRAGRW